MLYERLPKSSSKYYPVEKNKIKNKIKNMNNNREVSREEDDRRRFPPRFVVTLNQYFKPIL